MKENMEELTITTKDGRRYSFGYICRITDQYLTIERIKRMPIWESLSDQERQRLEQLFEDRTAWRGHWLNEIPLNEY